MPGSWKPRVPRSCDEVSCAEATLPRLTEPFCQQHHISADRRNVNVIGFAGTFDFVEILAVWITSGREANLHQNPQAFDRAWIICSRIFDPRSFLDLNHQASNPLQHC